MVEMLPTELVDGAQVHSETTDAQHGKKRAATDSENQELNDNSASRKRITRACDQCNQLRSKCNGGHPCDHCTENNLSCAYERVHKKRGRVPRKGQNGSDGMNNATTSDIGNGTNGLDISGNSPARNTLVETQHNQPGVFHGFGGLTDGRTSVSDGMRAQNGGFPPPAALDFAPTNPTAFDASTLDMAGFGFPLGDDFSVAFMGRAPMVESPDWFTFTSPNVIAGDQWATPPRPPDTLRYPVLRPILPFLEPIMPLTSACDLLEQYFGTVSSVSYHPKNIYVASFIFRKQSILHPTHPRPCTAALLASILWISAQHSDAPFLTSQPGARARTCQKLLELIISRLKPLVHNQEADTTGAFGNSKPMRNSAGLEVLAPPIDLMAGEEGKRQQVDNIVTYIHLGTIVSASERKAASLRWWNTAWSLARETRLGRELPIVEAIIEEHQSNGPVGGFKGTHDHHRTHSQASDAVPTDSKVSNFAISDEEREERRRTWWLLYMIDKHLALCYNRPVFFLNKECEGLLQPMDEHAYQTGHFGGEAVAERRNGLDVECTSLSVYGFMLPLMVILGEILDLNHARNRPRLGPGAKRPRDFSEAILEIEEQLGAFGHSLRRVWKEEQRRGNELIASSGETSRIDLSRRKNDRALQSKVVVAYGTHIMHVLHILLTGKWDPVALLDDHDFWISSQSFVNATSHAVSAAKALADIVDYDPELSFMPFFFGIYLLQGSFLLLLFADKLQDNITPEVVGACETIVRAHEACVSTLDTQYQRNFRRVMRSALQQLRGRLQEDVTEQQNWRREILKLYRWTGDGTGLAL